MNPFISQALICRHVELEQICSLLQTDSDFVITGVPGIGRRTLIRHAARQGATRCLEIDFLRCRNASQFLRALADAVTQNFNDPAELANIHQWSLDQPLTLDQTLSSPARLVWPALPAGKEWALFEGLLALPQHLAECLSSQVLIVFYNFPHIRSWDRQGKWETYLRQKIQEQNRVSYALIATVAEPWMYASHLPVIALTPFSDEELEPWIAQGMAAAQLYFSAEDGALSLFLSYAQGHIKDAIALAQRIWLDHRFRPSPSLKHEKIAKITLDSLQGNPAQVNLVHSQNVESNNLIQSHHVHSSMLSLVQDMSVTFEALLLLLPPTQARVLESLALDPTDSPQSHAYIKKHQLSRGGGLQGALNSLEQKGLIYGPKFGYRIALPLLNFWLKQRLQ